MLVVFYSGKEMFFLLILDRGEITLVLTAGRDQEDESKVGEVAIKEFR